MGWKACPDCQPEQLLTGECDEPKQDKQKCGTCGHAIICSNPFNKILCKIRFTYTKTTNSCLDWIKSKSWKDAYADIAAIKVSCPDCQPEPKPSEEFIKRVLTEPYDPRWKHTCIIKTEVMAELCRRIEQLEARIKELEAKDGKAIHGT